MKFILALALLTISALAQAGTIDELRQFGLVGHYGVTCHQVHDEAYIYFEATNDVPTIRAGYVGGNENSYTVEDAKGTESLMTLRLT